MNTNYELFGLENPTTLGDLEKARKTAILALHPDKHPEEVEEYTEKFKGNDPAYKRIKDAIKLEQKAAPKAAPAPKPKAKPTVVRKTPKRVASRRTPEEPETIDEYYVQKNYFPKLYTMTPEGDLITPERIKITPEGKKIIEPGRVFVLNPQVPATAEYINQQFADHKLEIDEAEKDLITAKKALNEIYIGYKNNINTAADVINANRNVSDKSSILSRIRQGDKSIEEIEGLEEKDLHSDNPYGATKIAEPVIKVFYTEFNWKYFWMNKPQEVVKEVLEDNEEQEDQEAQQGGAKREKTPEEKARIWAIIRAKKAKAASFK